MPSGPFMTSVDRTRRQRRVDYRVWCRAFIFEAIDWNFILERACSMRCDHSAKFIGAARHQGTFYMDRNLQFGDGRIWVARVRTPGPNYLAGGEKMLQVEACLKSEIANATFLKKRSSIPIQTVYGFDLGVTDEVGAPFVLFEHVGETTANELRVLRNGNESNMYGTREQDRKFRQKLAQIQAELATFTFGSIGSLTCHERSLSWEETTQNYFIGPELRTGKGPWTCSTEYFKDLANHELSACKDSGMRNVISRPSHLLPREFRHLMELYSCECPPASQKYHLMDQKLGADNLLVDEDFNIVGFLEWDGIMAAPIQQVVQYPRKTGFSMPPPGKKHVDMRDIERLMFTEKRRAEYLTMLKRAEQGGAVKISDDMHMVGATIMQGLVRYGDHVWDRTAPPGLSPWYDTPETLGRHLRDEEYVRVNNMWFEEYHRLVLVGVVAEPKNYDDDDDDDDDDTSSESSGSSREIVDY